MDTQKCESLDTQKCEVVSRIRGQGRGLRIACIADRIQNKFQERQGQPRRHATFLTNSRSWRLTLQKPSVREILSK